MGAPAHLLRSKHLRPHFDPRQVAVGVQDLQKTKPRSAGRRTEQASALHYMDVEQRGQAGDGGLFSCGRGNSGFRDRATHSQGTRG
jgi:hypothetical protein